MNEVVSVGTTGAVSATVAGAPASSPPSLLVRSSPGVVFVPPVLGAGFVTSGWFALGVLVTMVSGRTVVSASDFPRFNSRSLSGRGRRFHRGQGRPAPESRHFTKHSSLAAGLPTAVRRGGRGSAGGGGGGGTGGVGAEVVVQGEDGVVAVAAVVAAVDVEGG